MSCPLQDFPEGSHRKWEWSYWENTKYLLGGDVLNFLPEAAMGDILVEWFSALRKYRVYRAVIKDVTEVGASLSVLTISVLKTASLKFQHAGPNNSSPSFLVFSVPSVYPRNVTVHLNESWLVISWKPPPDDKINGILRGYDVIVRHGTQVTKVSSVATQYLSSTSSSFCSEL